MVNEREPMVPADRERAGVVLDAFDRHLLIGIG
jgi:hypothetical protein